MSLTDLWLIYTCDDEEFVEFAWMVVKPKADMIAEWRARHA